jgi:hypothetical protein
MSAEHSPLDPRLESWVAVVSYYWQRRGVSDQDRARLRVDLERDLRLALAEGATVDALVDADPNEFARELAEADGLPTAALRPDHSMTTTSLIVTALVGAIAGAVASAVLLYPLGLRLLDELALSVTGEGVFAIGLHVVAACICTVFAMAAVHWRFRFHKGIRRTTLLTGMCLLLGGAASVAPTMALAASLGYNNEAPVVVLEVGIVLAFCVAGLLIARWILTRKASPNGASA